MPDATNSFTSVRPDRTRVQLFTMALLRIAVGWHFAYEGLAKLFDPQWSAEGYLRSANWVGAGLFHRLAEDPTLLAITNQVNMWALVVIGAALMLGCATRLAAVAGMGLLALYYLAHPPLFAPAAGVAEGSYLIVNKNVVEMLALLVVATFSRGRLGLDYYLRPVWNALLRRLAAWRAGWQAEHSEPISARDPETLARRQALAGLVSVPFFGAFVMAVLKKRGYESQEEKQLANAADGLSGASMKVDWSTLDQLKGQVPAAKIKHIQLSRVMMGGNLMNGFAHARDLIYVSKLIRAYHDRDKVFETFRLAEACGINAIITNPILAPMIVDYWENCGGKIQFVAQCKGRDEQEFLDNIAFSIDHGACAAYVQGAAGDTYVSQGNFELIAKGLDRMRAAGMPAGIGAHYLRTIVECVEQGFEPDFWMKTLHHHNYWSARTDKQHDNIWCEEPDETIAFMKNLPQPWIAFKVLAAGSIHPKVGFKYAFENGADFVCVGMYDFQVVEDANLALDVLGGKLVRQRPWCA
jgi:uncharacterized membrane protein YphA (DoxX/SURF4 family)